MKGWTLFMSSPGEGFLAAHAFVFLDRCAPAKQSDISQSTGTIFHLTASSVSLS